MHTLSEAAAHQVLMGLYAEWRRITEEEAAAIQSWSWSRLETCHAAKEELQHRILDADDRATAEQQNLSRGKPGPDHAHTLRLQLRQVLGELIHLEVSNQALLSEQVQSGQRQRDELDRSVRNLRQVHRAYATRQGDVWHSYS